MDKNETTGDALINKPTNDNYRVGFDLIWKEKQEPKQEEIDDEQREV